LLLGLKKLRSRTHENQKVSKITKIHKAIEERGTSLGVQFFKETYDNRLLNYKEVCLVLVVPEE